MASLLQKWRAHAAVEYARKTGKIKPPKECQRCHRQRPLEAHHWRGYDKANYLNVHWLCHSCHTIVEDEAAKRRAAEHQERVKRQNRALKQTASRIQRGKRSQTPRPKWLR